MGALADLLAFNRNKDYQAEQAQQVSGLLDQYRVQGDPNTQNPGPWGINQPEMQQAMLQQQGGYRQPTGLLGAMPPSEFYLKAATVPGLTQPMLTQAQAQQGMMDRQVQEQTFKQSNMSAAELANYTLQEQQMQWRRDTEERQFTQLSAYQRATLARMGGGGGGGGVAQPGMAQIGAVPAGHMMTMDPLTGQPVLTPIQGGEQWRTQRENVQKLETGVGALDEMIKFVREKGSFESGAEGGRIATGPRQTVISGLAALNNMGVLQPGELAALTEQVIDPTAWSSLGTLNSTVVGKLEGVRDRFVKASRQATSRTPGAASAPPPPQGFR
jgi:hypothetical protein